MFVIQTLLISIQSVYDPLGHLVIAGRTILVHFSTLPMATLHSHPRRSERVAWW